MKIQTNPKVVTRGEHVHIIYIVLILLLCTLHAGTQTDEAVETVMCDIAIQCNLLSEVTTEDSNQCTIMETDDEETDDEETDDDDVYCMEDEEDYLEKESESRLETQCNLTS